jgi:hypothetical protein
VVDPRLLPLRDLFASYARSRVPGEVRSVAVVGNAPMVPSAARAATIDGCDLVLRTNSFVLDRPDADPVAGRRTDVVLWGRMVRATPSSFSDYRSRLYVLLEPMRMFHRPEVWPGSWPEDLGLVVARNDAVAVPLLDALDLPWRAERIAPTTGTTAAWLARALFPDADVHLTGLSYVADPAPGSWDYQSGARGRIGPEHRISAEGALLRRWWQEGTVRFWPTDSEEEAA